MRPLYDYNFADELTESETTDISTSSMVDRETWGLDDGGNWMSHTRSSDDLMETRSLDNAKMNRLDHTGGAGSLVIEGGVNEYADISVNDQPAEFRSNALGGFRYRRSVAETPGTNTVTVKATDKDSPPNTTTRQWSFDVPTVQRSFTYDRNGNTLSDGLRTFTWDTKNRLKSVTVAGTTTHWD